MPTNPLGLRQQEELGPKNVEITLKYDGVEVDDGTMAVEDVLSALRGFSNAYGKIAAALDPNGQHQIRVSAIKRSSFAVTIVAWMLGNKEALLIGTPIAAIVVTSLLKLVELKKATKGKPPSGITINGSNNTVSVTTAGDNTTIIVPANVYEIFTSKLVDSELTKIAAPLREDAIDAVSISATGGDGQFESVVITNSEKPFFQSESAATATSKSLHVDGHFVSLNKESSRGLFRMQNGTSVRYHYTGDDPTSLHVDFAHRGPVRVECTANFDGSLELKSLDIAHVERLQGDLFGSPKTDPT